MIVKRQIRIDCIIDHLNNTKIAGPTVSRKVINRLIPVTEEIWTSYQQGLDSTTWSKVNT